MTNPTLLSYSTIELLHSCPRKYELVKELRAVEKGDLESESIDLVFGSACGEGIQELLVSGNLSKAIWKAFKTWSTRGMELDTRSKKKSFPLVVQHLSKFALARPSTGELDGWVVATINGKPAIEVGFSIKLNDRYSYRGFIDAILYHPIKKLYKVLEIKTDGWSPTPVKYQNSFQGSSYTLLLERMLGIKSDAVTYLVLYCPSLEQLCYEFPKNPVQKLDWLVSLSYDCQDIDMYKARNYFPKRGSACFNFFRPCSFIGLCDLKSLGKRAPGGGYLEPEAEAREKYDFHFTLDELANG